MGTPEELYHAPATRDGGGVRRPCRAPSRRAHGRRRVVTVGSVVARGAGARRGCPGKDDVSRPHGRAAAGVARARGRRRAARVGGRRRRPAVRGRTYGLSGAARERRGRGGDGERLRRARGRDGARATLRTADRHGAAHDAFAAAQAPIGRLGHGAGRRSRCSRCCCGASSTRTRRSSSAASSAGSATGATSRPARPTAKHCGGRSSSRSDR